MRTTFAVSFVTVTACQHQPSPAEPRSAAPIAEVAPPSEARRVVVEAPDIDIPPPPDLPEVPRPHSQIWRGQIVDTLPPLAPANPSAPPLSPWRTRAFDGEIVALAPTSGGARVRFTLPAGRIEQVTDWEPWVDGAPCRLVAAGDGEADCVIDKDPELVAMPRVRVLVSKAMLETITRMACGERASPDPHSDVRCNPPAPARPH